MENIILAILAGVCAYKWFVNYMTSEMLIRYMLKNGLRFPDDEEIKECVREFITAKKNKR